MYYKGEYLKKYKEIKKITKLLIMLVCFANILWPASQGEIRNKFKIFKSVSCLQSVRRRENRKLKISTS